MKTIVLSLFDGMSCGQISLRELNIPVKKYYASEIDKFAIAQTQLNFPETIQLGDIENWRNWQIDWSRINLVLAGSPCQGFSFAGKQLNFKDPRSKLFFVFVDILNHCKKFNPDVKYLLENVKMKKEYQRVINNTLGLFPVRINSNLVSAQNRDRLYWTNIHTKKVGLFNEIHSDIPQPKDRGILLKDILQDESEIDGKYYLSDKAISRMLRKQYSNPKINPEKTGTLSTRNNSGQLALDSGTTLIGLDINKKAPTQRNSTGRCLDKKHNYQIIRVDKKGNKKTDQNKAGCLTAGAHSGGNHSDMGILCVNTRNGEKQTYQQDRIYNIDGKMVALNAELNGRNNILIQKGHGFNKGGIFEEKSPTLLSNSWEHNNHIDNGYKLRRLTPLECARLQTVPSWYKWNCSDTQQYKMLGNGWTIEVIEHILSFL